MLCGCWKRKISSYGVRTVWSALLISQHCLNYFTMTCIIRLLNKLKLLDHPMYSLVIDKRIWAGLHFCNVKMIVLHSMTYLNK